MDTMTGEPANPLLALRQFARRRAAAPQQCEMCGAEIGGRHEHLVEPAERKLLCVCQGCAILFSDDGRTKFRRVPRDVDALPGFEIDDAVWNALAIPIGLAFFFHSSAAGKVMAIYPSPAGATESLLDLKAWDDLARDNALLAGMKEDTQALLVNRLGQAREYYRVPIDVCYELVGLVRIHWKGLSGGAAMEEALAEFFEHLAQRAGAGRPAPTRGEPGRRGGQEHHAGT